MPPSFVSRTTLITLLFAVGCAAPAAPPSQPPEGAAVASAPVEPEAAVEAEAAATPVESPSPEAEAEPAEESFVPTEAVPLGDEVIGHVGLPCGTPTDCPKRAVFDAKVSLFAKAEGGKPMVRNAKPDAKVVAEIADEGGKGQRTQVICKAQDYSARVFIGQSDLRPVTKDFTLATPSRTPSDPSLGLSLIPGSVVEVRRTKGNATEIGFEQWGLSGSGWVPKDAVGRFYVPATTDPRGVNMRGKLMLMWRTPVPVRAAPGGRAFAKIDGPVSVLRSPEAREGHLLVTVGLNIEGEPHAVGWVSAAAVEGGGGVLGGVLGGRPSAVVDEALRVSVPAESTLQSASGDKIGIVRNDTELECVADCETDRPVVRVECVAGLSAWVVPPTEAR